MKRLLIGLMLLAACRGDAHHEDEHDHEKHQGEGRDAVHLSSAALARSGVKVAAVTAEPLVGGFEVVAEIEANPDRVAHLSTVVPGQIVAVRASIGDRVKAGQVLAELRSADLGQARAGVSQARASLEVARSNFERQKELQASGIGARRDFLEAEAALRRAEAESSAAEQRLGVLGGGGSGGTTALKSPIDGEVISRHATIGEIASPEEPLFVVADLRRVWVVGRLYEQDVGMARVGAAAVLTLQAYPHRSWPGKVEYVAPTLDEATRTLSVRLELDNAEGLLRPGLFGALSITPPDASEEAVPVVIEEAIQRLGESEVVFVPGDKEGEFTPRPVKTGARRAGRVHIREGLAPNDKYVAAGAFVLKSELLKDEMGEGHAH